MPLRSVFLLCLPALLTACAKTDAPVRLDFLGLTGLVSGKQTASPNDTLTTRAYAVGNDNNLTHLRITVKYEPTRNPLVYPTPASSYNPKNTPDDDELVYLDSVLNIRPTALNSKGREIVFTNKFAARSTSGTELWRYTVTDAAGQSASRAYRLTVRNRDSLLAVHSYTALLRPVPQGRPRADSLRNQARVFLSLRSGLLLPRYAVINQQHSLQSNQGQLDAVCVARGATIGLEAPAAATQLPLLPGGNGRRTRLLATTLTAAQFATAATTAALNTAFAAGQPFVPDSLSTGALATGSVLAFKTADGYTGLLLVNKLSTGTAPLLSCSIRVQK